MLSSSRDNWERLVAAAVKKNEIWELCHQNSMTTVSSNSQRNSDFSGEILSDSSSQSERFFVSPPHLPPIDRASRVEARENASTPITRKLFSALLRRRKPKDYDLGQGLVGIPEDHFGFESFSQRELLVATDNFNDKNLLRRDGHGTVFKGRLADGSLVAVKRLRQEITATELEFSSTFAHHNVLRARGSCITEEEKLLVYPCMVNGSVASWLRERHEPQPPLGWETRKLIAVGAARGLAYLHFKNIIHRNVKPTNVLLDRDFRAVISDLNLALLMDRLDDDVDIPVAGTIGYMAPEYCLDGKCSMKNDVYAYGVFLLELITAQKVYDLARLADDNDMVLSNWVKHIYEEKEWKMIVDADLQGDFIGDEVGEMMQIALICTRTDPVERPTMLEVVRMLVEHDLAEMEEEDILELGDVGNFTLDNLRVATEDFSIKIISEDGFNMIYKGWLDGYPVAVKRYNSPSLKYYFEKELEIGRICSHTNLVRVIGFCRAPEEQLLVFRLMINGSVESWLRGRDESRPPLTWLQRKRIALGVARGLAFLHDKCIKKIIHSDVKAANVLLDENFDAVVADFKMAAFIHRDKTHITTTVTGTIGHIAPEHLASGKCSDKTDVFGYGAFLLELITGKRIIELLGVANDKDMMCADWVKKNYEERSWTSMVDTDSGGHKLMNSVVKQLVEIAVLCTQYDPDQRPRMSEVVGMFGAAGGAAERSDKRSKKVMFWQ